MGGAWLELLKIATEREVNAVVAAFGVPLQFPTLGGRVGEYEFRPAQELCVGVQDVELPLWCHRNGPKRLIMRSVNDHRVARVFKDDLVRAVVGPAEELNSVPLR